MRLKYDVSVLLARGQPGDEIMINMIKPLGLVMLVLGGALETMLAGAATPAMPATVPSSQPAKELTLDLGDKVTLKLVLIPAGKFLMGSPVTEKDRDTDEIQHEVTISKPFYMGITPVTVDEFAAFVKDSGYTTEVEKFGGGRGGGGTVAWRSRTANSTPHRWPIRGATRVLRRRAIIRWCRCVGTIPKPSAFGCRKRAARW